MYVFCHFIIVLTITRRLILFILVFTPKSNIMLLSFPYDCLLVFATFGPRFAKRWENKNDDEGLLGVSLLFENSRIP